MKTIKHGFGVVIRLSTNEDITYFFEDKLVASKFCELMAKRYNPTPRQQTAIKVVDGNKTKILLT